MPLSLWVALAWLRSTGSIMLYEPAQTDRFLRIVLPSTDWCLAITIFNSKISCANKFAHDPGKNAANYGGWFTRYDNIRYECRRLDGAKAFISVNPVKLSLLDPKKQEIKRIGGRECPATKDQDIESIRFVIIDIDADRPDSGQSATDEERDHAIDLQTRILTECPEIAACAAWGCSGNGGWILVYVGGLPNDAETHARVKGFLHSMADRFGVKGRGPAYIDTNTCNPMRGIGIPGTMKCKGKSTPERPWRMVTIDGMAEGFGPSGAVPVPLDLGAYLTDHPAPTPVKYRPTSTLALTDGSGSATQRKGGGARHHTDAERVRRAEAWLTPVDGAIDGSHVCHIHTYYTVHRLIWGFDLSASQARPMLAAWNQRCVPPWTDPELEHKIDEAETKPDSEGRPRGYMLDQDRPGWRQKRRAESKARADDARTRAAKEGREVAEISDDDLESEYDSPIGVISNYDLKSQKNKAGEIEWVKIGLAAQQIDTAREAEIGQWPKRVAGTLFAEGDDGKPIYLESASQLFAYFDGRIKVSWTRGDSAITQDRYYEHLRQTAESYDALETVPHFPAMDKTYYMHDAIESRDTGKLDGLVGHFVATDHDRELIKAYILTLFWGGPPGERPAFLVTSAAKDTEGGRGTGKSTLVAILADELVGGFIEAKHDGDMETVKTRMLTPESRQFRIVRFDNIKVNKLSVPDLEGLITSSIVSGRQLYKGDGRRPNTLTYVLTMNGAATSKDLAQRVITIVLQRPTFKADWAEKLRKFIRENRAEILADARFLVERSPGDFMPSTRWASWESAILAKTNDPSQCLHVTMQRQNQMDMDETLKRDVREKFMDNLRECGFDPEDAGINLLIPSAIAASWLEEVTEESILPNFSSAKINRLGIEELEPVHLGRVRGFYWRRDHTIKSGAHDITSVWGVALIERNRKKAEAEAAAHANGDGGTVTGDGRVTMTPSRN